MSEIRRCFNSRFDDGYLMEFDFGQLEVVALAHLSQDKQLMADIINGVDLHVVSASNLFNVLESNVTVAQRKVAKALSFQLQYGAGYKSMAKKCKIAEDLAKKFITEYYMRYPQVQIWQLDNIVAIEASRVLSSHSRTIKGLPQGIGTMVSRTGRRYKFKEYDAPDWSKAVTSFSPTEIKNYPVQGFATGDIVPMVLGKVFRALKLEDEEFNKNVLMINTVHDSIVFDVQADWTRTCYDVVYPAMHNVSGYLKQHFDIDFTLPLGVDCQAGRNWMDMFAYE